MKNILGKPLIGYVFEQLKYSKRINKVILATSEMPSNDPLAEYVKSLGFDVFRGFEDDVLNRFYKAALEFNADVVVRVTGDSPLLDPEICDRLIEFYEKKKVDYVCTGKKFAEGVDCEVFSFAALEKAFQKARLASEREHVTAYMYKHPEQFTTVLWENEEDDSRLRFTVDEPEDLEVAEKIIGHLYSPGKPFTYSAVKDFIMKHPEIYGRNSHIIRNEGYLKSLKKDRVVK